MSSLQFPSTQDFDVVNKNKIVKWGELPQEIYAVTNIKSVVGKYGESFIGDLETEKGEKFQAWLPLKLGNDIMEYELPVFVRHEGLKQSHISSNKFHAYTVLVSK